MASHQQRSKRPFNLLLSEENVRQARHFTNNPSATVDSLLADYMTRQRQGKAVAEAWNRFHAVHASFADDHSTL
jgi:antitoxin CcdA